MELLQFEGHTKLQVRYRDTTIIVLAYTQLIRYESSYVIAS